LNPESLHLFADDAKIYKEISCEDDVSGLQADLDQLQKWSDTWLLKFHPNKCKVMTVSNKTKSENKSSYTYITMKGKRLNWKCQKEKRI
jgi:hypothetical protein